MADTNNTQHLTVASGMFMIVQYLIKVFIAHIGSSTTAEAEISTKTVARALGSLNFDEQLKMDLNFLLNQTQSRRKTLQNIFFVISWNFILAVIGYFMLNFYK